MKKRLIKFTTLMSALTILMVTMAFAATNMYGKNYDTTKTGHICSMKAKGDGDVAQTIVTNTANSKRYYSAYVNRVNMSTGKIIEKDVLEKLVNSGSKITVSVARYRSTDSRKHEHQAISWNCSTVPSGAGYTNFKDDTLSYTVVQNK